MRNFRHLTKTEIREIYTGYLTDEPKLAIARRIGIDNSTVHYHINKIKNLPEAEVIALITPPCQRCEHISFKCLVCGRPSDNIKSEQLQTIRDLRGQVATLERRLLKYENNTTFSSSASGPIAIVSC